MSPLGDALSVTLTQYTEDYVETGYWSTIEVPVGIICACMPAVRSLFSLALPKVFGTTRDGIGSNFNTYGPSSSANRLGLDSRNKISVKQEWSVLSEGPDDHNDRHGRSGSGVELLNVGGVKNAGVGVGDALTDDDDDLRPTRKMTLSKQGGAWRGMSIPEQREKAAAFTHERELLR